MKPYEAIKMAIKTVLQYKLRTILTMLGIIIGIASVIILVSVAKGTKAQVTGKIQNLGSNLIYVNIIGRGSTTALTYNQTMKFSKLNGVAAVSPVVSTTATVMRSDTSQDGLTIAGTNSNYLTLRNLQLRSGRFISPMDLVYRTRTAVLGSAISQDFFGFINPVGQSLQINGITFEVIGVLKTKGSSIAGSDDDKIFIPESTAERSFYINGIKDIFIQTASSQTVTPVLNKLTKQLNKAFNNDTSSYKIMNEQDMLNTVNSVSNLMTLLLGGIASISLLVGGIGIMNIMLVSVTERTKEIGIRKALGARRSDILNQILIESIFISLIAGFIGIVLGVTGTRLLAATVHLAVALSLRIILLSLGFSVGIGVFFGILPALKASKLNPIQALKFD